MKNKKRFYPASMVDEVAYLFERSTPYSLTFSFVMTLEGDIDSEAVHKALDASLTCYPKLKCVLVDNYPSRRRWFGHAWECRDVRGKDILEETELSQADYTHQNVISDIEKYHSAHAIDITSQPPLKVLLIRSGRRVHLIFFVHHAAVDGMAFIFFVQTFIKYYESIFYQRTPEDHCTPDYESISQPRVRFRWNNFSPRLINTFIKNNSLPKREPPVQLFPREEEQGEKKLIAAVRELSSNQFQFLRDHAREKQTTINNYLLASMFRTIKSWNRRWHDTSERIYVSVPINLRPPGDRTVGNIISGYYFSLRTEAIRDNNTVLGLMQQEWPPIVEHARRNINLLWFFKPLPLTVKRKMFKLQNSSTYPTLLISNWGTCHLNPDHTDSGGFHCMGEASIRNITTIPHPVLWPQLTVITYNNTVSIGFAVFRSHFPVETAEEFLQFFIEELLAEEQEEV